MKDLCNESLWNYISQNETCNTTDVALIGNKETYLERSLGFLIVGSIGILSNLVAIFVLGSSAKIRQKLVNTLIIHQSFIDLLASIALVGMAHLDGTDQHGLEGLHAEIYCYFVMNKFPLSPCVKFRKSVSFRRDQKIHLAFYNGCL